MTELEQLNQIRKQCANKCTIGIISAVIGVVLYLVLPDFFFLGLIFIVVGVIFGSIGTSNFQKIRSQFKNEYLTKIIQEVYKDATYNPTTGLSPEEVYRCGLLKRADRYHSEDLIRGSFSDVSFVTCDLKLEERHVRHTKNGTQVYYVTYFQGRFFELEFPKSFKGKIVVTEGMMMTWFTNLKKMEMESVEFNKKFNTYSSDEHNTFYVLTPHLMESLLELEHQNPGTIACSFDGPRLTIAINNFRDTFELKMFSEIDASSIEAMKKELSVINNIIEELRLNRNIFNNKEENI